jgi:hypothetical protein
MAALVAPGKVRVEAPTVQVAATVAVTVMGPVAVAALAAWLRPRAATNKHRRRAVPDLSLGVLVKSILFIM